MFVWDRKILPLSLFIISLFVPSYLLAEVSVPEAKPVKTAKEAENLAAQYQKLADYYQKQAKKLKADSASKTNSTSSSDRSDKAQNSSSSNNKTIKQVDQAQKKSPWSGTNATLGFQYNTGNTFQRNLSASSNISYKASKNILNTLTMSYQNAFDYNQDSTTANKFFASGQSEYDFSQYNGVYLNVQYLNDQLSGYSYQVNENVGYKRRLYQRNGMSLDLFFGPGMQQTKQTQETGGQFNNEPSVQVKTQYKWILDNKTNYSQMLQWIKTPRHYTVGLTMALTTSLYNSFGLQPSFTLNYDSNPPIKSGAQLKKLDTTTQLSFVYNF